MNTLGEKYATDWNLFNMKLWIADYFDGITNRIDLLTERYLAKCEEKNKVHEKRKFNLIRAKFMDSIKKIQEFNLRQFEMNEEMLVNKMESFKVQSNVNNHDLINEMAKLLFKKFCIFINSKNLTSKYRLGLLIITDWYMSDSDVSFLK